MLKLESAAADVSEIFAKQANRGLCFHLRARLVEFLFVDQHVPREDESLSTFAGGCQSAVEQKFVQSESQVWPGTGRFRQPPRFARGCSTKVPALAPVQSAEPSLVESLTTILSPFSTELCTVVLKTFFLCVNQRRKPPARGGSLGTLARTTASQPLPPAIFDQYRSWSERSPRHPGPQPLPSTASLCSLPNLPPSCSSR